MYNVNYEYLLVLFILTLLVFIRLSVHNKIIGTGVSLFFIFVAAVIVGTRPLDAGFDTQYYVDGYNLIGAADSIWNVSYLIKTELGIGSDFGFWSIAYIINKFGFSDVAYLYLNAFISISILYYALSRIFLNKTILFVFVFLMCGTFYNTYGNAIRQSYVISFFPLLMYYRFISTDFKKCIFIMVVMFLFHKGGGGVSLLFFMATFLNFRTLLFMYLLAFPLSIFTKMLLGRYFNVDMYSISSSVLTNFPFVLANITFILIFLLSKMNYIKERLSSEVGYSLYASFLILLSISILFSFNEFAYNRVANFSYFIQSLLVSYVILSLIRPKSIVACVLLLVSLVWGVMILNSESVSVILYG